MKCGQSAALAGLVLLTAGAAPGPAYVELSRVTLPSTDTSWDYITFDQASGRLFIARRADGLTVMDMRGGTAPRTVDNSTGANGVVLVPEFRRGYTAMTDGSVLSFDLATLQPIARVPLDAGDLNQGMYDPATKRVHMIVGARPDRTTWVTLDAATGAVLGRTVFDSKKMDDPTPDGHGAIYAPMRDRNVLNRLDSETLAIQATWPLGPCVQPVAVEYDHAGPRVLMACRGDKPVFLALDPADGRITATLPIGRGVDGMVQDEGRHLIVTAGGVDGTMSIIEESTPGQFRLLETLATHAMARVLATDRQTGRLFTVTANHTQPAPGPDGKPTAPTYHRDSFTVLTYGMAPK